MADSRTLSAREAAEQLGVTAATLYAYVSRGMLRSEASPGDSRQRRYLVEDVQCLIEKKANRQDPRRTAQHALHWGTPVLESALTLIDDGHLYYRGHAIEDLVHTHSFEQVAGMLWNNPESSTTLPDQPLPENFLTLIGAVQAPITRMQIALAFAAENDRSAYRLSPTYVAETGWRIFSILLAAITCDQGHHEGIAQVLAKYWGTRHVNLLNAALILCADHELNASSFTARLIASTDATPYEVTIGGLAALNGTKHGGIMRRITAMLKEIDYSDSIEQAIDERLKHGDPLPGFGHRLYPTGDPRAKILLDLMRKFEIGQTPLIQADRICHAVHDATGEYPTIDFALIGLERMLALPSLSALTLFALGRTAGWIGHAIEQYQSGTLIRPRASYKGRIPDSHNLPG